MTLGKSNSAALTSRQLRRAAEPEQTTGQTVERSAGEAAGEGCRESAKAQHLYAIQEACIMQAAPMPAESDEGDTLSAHVGSGKASNGGPDREAHRRASCPTRPASSGRNGSSPWDGFHPEGEDATAGSETHGG